MSQPPQGQPPYGPDGQPLSGDQSPPPPQGGGWGQQPAQPQPGPGWGQPSAPPQQPGPGWAQQPGQPALGGYGPPPGQGGGWGGPPAPGYGEQPTQVGGFGVPGGPPYPGGPGWTPPGGAGPQGGGNSKKKNLIITAVAVLALVVVVAVVLVVALGGDATSTASRGSSSPTSTSSSASSGGFSSSPPGSADPAGFIGQLPADFTDCADEQLAGDGDVAAATCGAAQNQPGPAQAGFNLYPDLDTLHSVFQSEVEGQGLTEFADGGDCSTGTGYGEWTYSTGATGGRVACQITGDGNVLVAWTDDGFLTEGIVMAPGNTQAEVSTLYDWWTANSEYRG